MKNQILKVILLLIMVSTLSCVRIPQNKSQWHHPLYIANNDYWRQRIPVSIQNNMDRELLGDPLEIKVGKDRGQAPLAGALAEGIRVTTPVVEGINFKRPDRSVKLYKAYDVPPGFSGRNASSNKVNITDDPHTGSAAQMFISSWCGAGANGIMVNGNSVIDKLGTIGHKYQLDLLDVPVGYLNRGVIPTGQNSNHLITELKLLGDLSIL